MKNGGSLGSLIWVIVGILVAIHYDYNSVSNVSHILSFILAILLWPLLFLGVGLHVTL
jgi:hypothetical protein